MADPLELDFIALQGALAGQYSLEKELGRGGMGVVYLAREVQLDRPVALKVLPPALAASAPLRERFLREARTAAKLSHPNIVPIFRVDDVEGYVFFAMGYVDGETLTSRVRARGPLPAHEATRLVQEVAWALAYAHLRGVVHRDVKPDNILIERESGRAMVTDFGIAQVQAATALTDVGQVMGTAHYMSPEQAAGEPVDGRSDLYALGIVAHFALAGKLPFDGPTVQSILAKQITQPPPPLASIAPTVPRPVALAIDRCLAKEPGQRYATGEALAEALTQAQGQRREIPAPLRVWLQKGDAFKWLYPVYYLTFGMSAVFDPEPISTPVILVLPLVLHGLLEIYQTRRVFAAGFDREALVTALREYVERRHEELQFEFGGKPPLLWRLVRWFTYGAFGVAVLSAVAMLAGFNFPGVPWFAPLVCYVMGTMVTVAGCFIGLYNPGRRLEKQDELARLRLKLWSSKLGERLARIARWRLRPRVESASLVNRPTEVAIGLAVGDLYAALPKAQQRQLRDLPDAVRRLEDEARAMRRRVEELDEKLAAAGGEGSAVLDRYGDASLAAHRERVADELRAARDAAARRLATAVAALENIRLDLLRLQAGAGSVQSLTAALAAARRIGEEVDAVTASPALPTQA